MSDRLKPIDPNVFVNAQKHVDFINRVYGVRDTLTPEGKDVERTPIHFDQENWKNGVFVVLKMEIGADPIGGNGGTSFKVSERTRRILSQFEIPFSDGVPAPVDRVSQSVK